MTVRNRRIKKILSAVLVLSLLLMLMPPSITYSQEEIITFADTNLEAVVRSEIGKTSGEDIYISDVAVITYLDATASEIVNLEGLQYLTNLEELYLDENQISDISSLSGLTNLTTLWLFDNQASDISPLSGLTNLVELDLVGNQISDISHLSGLNNLNMLWLVGNEISDIS